MIPLKWSKKMTKNYEKNKTLLRKMQKEKGRIKNVQSKTTTNRKNNMGMWYMLEGKQCTLSNSNKIEKGLKKRPTNRIKYDKRWIK